MTKTSPAADDVLRFSCGGIPRQLARGGVHLSNVAEVYRDTPASDLIAIIDAIESGTPWREAVSACYAASNPWLHRIVTDPSRDLFFRLHAPPAHSRILDVGAGWGQIALPLAREGLVCALEPTPERLQFIRAAARQEEVEQRMWFVQADFLATDFADPFDLITCIGVLEWIPRFAPHRGAIEAQREFLARARALLVPGGQLVIGIENRLGLKYLLGAPDDHIGHAGIACYDHDLADRKWREINGEPLRSIVHTRVELEELLDQAGFSTRQVFCAFPDYKLPRKILPWGPATNEFLRSYPLIEHEGLTGSDLPFQAELQSHYRSFAHLGIAADLAPSFIIVASDSNGSSDTAAR